MDNNVIQNNVELYSIIFNFFISKSFVLKYRFFKNFLFVYWDHRELYSYLQQLYQLLVLYH